MPSRGAVLACLALLLATVLAGCTKDAPAEVVEPDPIDIEALLSQPIYDTLEDFGVKVAGHDGKMQDTWVFKPVTDDPEARFPVFINFSPYWGNLAPTVDTGGDAFSQYMIDYFVPRGYAVVLASVRGTGDSEGCFPIGGIPELEDAYAVIDHFANIEWSNGNVSAGGKSYDGTTIQGVAGYKPHPALKLIFPVSGISDLYRYNYRGGAPYGHGAIFNTYYYAGEGMMTDGDVTAQSPQAIADDVVCPELPMMQASGVGTAVLGTYNDYWNERDYNRYAENVETAFFYVHGLQDWNVKPDHILPWLSALPADVPKKVWLHQWVDDGTGHVYPMRQDWNLTMLRMMDHFLKGIDTGILEEPMVQVQDSSGRWRNEDTWPPAHVVNTTLYLGRGGVFVDEPEDGLSEYTIPGLNGGRLTWQMELDEPLHYAGVPVLHGMLGTTDPETTWVWQIHMITPDGERVWMNEGVLKAKLRDSMQEASQVSPDQHYLYAIEFYPQDDYFPAGSIFELTVDQQGSRFVVTQPSVSRTSVTLGNDTYLMLPIVQARNVALESPQPVETACWAC